MKHLFFVALFTASFFSGDTDASNDLINPELYSLNTLSFVYHAYAPAEHFNQYFNNKLFSIEKKLTPDSPYNVIAGSIINSEANRCMLLGMGHSIWTKNEWSFEGEYMYAGEFFFKEFAHCGDSGTYHRIKELTGIGFAPYIYYGSKYSFNQYISAKAGIIIPGIIVFNLQLNF